MRVSAPVTIAAIAASRSVAAQGLIGDLLGQLTSLGEAAVQTLTQLGHDPPQTNPPFDAATQYVSNSGDHEWQAPGPNDARGPCPGLNVLANHGYIPRNGYATVLDLTSGVTEVFNMGLDLATILAAYGAIFDGAGVAWSIGGGQNTGIGGSRGNYESDSSPTRGDLNVYGSSTDLVMSQFVELFNMQPDPETANYDVDVISQFRANRFNESIATNPMFYYGPFAGVGVTQAAYLFMYRFMANHSETDPAGRLDQETLKSFFGVSGDSPENFTWQAGYERIPDNWYRRAQNDSYGLQQLAVDAKTITNAHPYVGVPGCNQGTVNSYVPFNETDTDLADYNFADPIQVVCFALAEATAHDPLIGATTDAVAELVLPLQDAIGCDTVPLKNSTVGKTCPGYSLYGGPTGPVAPGARPVKQN